ncbi:MAG: hypothetical protein P4L71_20015 [Acetobacteraceae bacterium]|nr:hypothetical protein [Acetobacteraceae bacterium]
MPRKEVSLLPEPVKIGYRTYHVEAWEHLAAMSAERRGECSHIEHVIRVDTVYGKTETAEILLHEILHAVWTVFRLEEGDTEERIISASANGLTAVWLDNPGLLAWFQSNLGVE